MIIGQQRRARWLEAAGAAHRRKQSGAANGSGGMILRGRFGDHGRLWLGAVLVLLLAITPGALALAKDKSLQDDPLLAGAERFEQGAKEISEVNLDKNMLQMAAGFMKGDDEAMQLAKKMDFVYVRSFEYANEGQYKLADLEGFRGRLNEANWSHVVKERTATETTDVWIKTGSEGEFNELMVISAEPKELTFVHLKGHMSMEELSRVGAKYGVPQSSAPETKLKGRGR